MKLTVQRRPEDSGLIAPWSTVFHAPGGTIGRATDNHLTLPDATNDICRVQAAVRISDDTCYVVNLSSMSHVSINGRAVLRDQEVLLSPGDELVIGSYTLCADDPLAPASDIAAPAAIATGFAALDAQAPAPVVQEPDPLLESPLIDSEAIADAPAVVQPTVAPPPQAPPQPQASQATLPHDSVSAPAPVAPLATPERETLAPPAAAIQEEVAPPPAVQTGFDSPPTEAWPLTAEAEPHDFALDEPQPTTPSNVDVFSDLFGPGTLPVGSAPDVGAHPFDMASAQHRNPEDPLRHLPRGDANVSGPARDPLDLLSSADSDGLHDVFSDQTPSTLPSDDPLAPHRLDPLNDTLGARREDQQGGWAARDHLREYGGYMRPARVQPTTSKENDADDEPETPSRR